MVQRYELLKNAVADSELLLQNGRGDVLMHQKLTVALYRAEAELCPTPAERVKVYEKLVDALAAQQESLERQAEAGRATQVQVAQDRLVILDARIDLERLRLGQPVAQRSARVGTALPGERVPLLHLSCKETSFPQRIQVQAHRSNSERYAPHESLSPAASILVCIPVFLFCSLAAAVIL
jgi:hypothetical protein